ncbi:hypothetical protein CC1G_11277 [Coprinopsis cinerea okayama7|uniref:F-box domain-containing protein n=1 Tax=Coprinopsis cinerea (strain Okayama-7 / 130 / ATCC MYA-4618 / FGSC 9003) TaxID=240176 RepID=A8PDM6_COPC7|nr:hypothetical protein CC1G_11277 [Coprinopsis cinerea okayama7\|eukprot:XP_001840629.1 hypothetical protein CC1G_11277 [Coprinopsis cinerea okayama7\
MAANGDLEQPALTTCNLAIDNLGGNASGSLLALPTELLFAILRQLDFTSLCSVEQTCWLLNSIASSIFLGRIGMRRKVVDGRVFDNISGGRERKGGGKSETRGSSSKSAAQIFTPKETLPILRTAFSITNLNSIRFRFSYTSLPYHIEEVKDLTALVRRQTCARVLDSLELDFGELDRWFMGRAPEPDDQRWKEEWVWAFTHFLTVIGSLESEEHPGSRCRSFKIVGGEELVRYFEEFEKLQKGWEEEAELAGVVIQNVAPTSRKLSIRRQELNHLPKAVNPAHIFDAAHDVSPTFDEPTSHQTRDKRPKPRRSSIHKLGKWVRSHLHANSGQQPRGTNSTVSPREDPPLTSLAGLEERHVSRQLNHPEPHRPHPSGEVSPALDHYPHSQASNMQRIDLHSDLMFFPAILPYTITLLQSSDRLDSLEVQVARPPKHPDFWLSFLSSCSFPNLRAFSVTSSFKVQPDSSPKGTCRGFMQSREPQPDPHASTPGIPPQALTPFLIRHPSIETLRVDGPLNPLASKFASPERGQSDLPILPNLRSITAHPLYVSWVVNPQRVQALGNGGTMSDPLKEITILTQDYQNLSVGHWMMDDVFRCLGGHLREKRRTEESHGTGARSSDGISLGIKFTTYNGLDSWIRSHVSVGMENGFVGKLNDGVTDAQITVMAPTPSRSHPRTSKPRPVVSPSSTSLSKEGQYTALRLPPPPAPRSSRRIRSKVPPSNPNPFVASDETHHITSNALETNHQLTAVTSLKIQSFFCPSLPFQDDRFNLLVDFMGLFGVGLKSVEIGGLDLDGRSKGERSGHPSRYYATGEEAEGRVGEELNLEKVVVERVRRACRGVERIVVNGKALEF